MERLYTSQTCWLARMFAGLVLVIAPALAAETTAELPAGSVVYAGAGQTVTDTEAVVLRRDAVRVTTVLRNADTRERPVLMAFALPDIDMAALDGAAVSVLSYDAGNPTNFVGFWARADGADVQLEVEQRALALGLMDATAMLSRHAVPLYPLTADVADTLTALSPEARDELLALSLTRANDGQFEPFWTLKTLFHWRQTIPASGQVRLTYGYQPVTGSSPWTEDTAAALTERFCVGKADADVLTRRAARGGFVTAHWVQFQPGNSGQLRGPISDYSVTVEKSSEQTLIATCREGFTRTAGGALQFKAVDHTVEDETIVAFIE
jgi:Domain of unknown function (DUF4424)